MSVSLEVARTLFYGFQSMYADFQGITLGGRARFEQRDWHAVHAAQAERTDIYRSKVLQLVPQVLQVGGEAVKDLAMWRRIRADFERLISRLPNGDIAESFYNSVIGRLHTHEDITDEYAFITPCLKLETLQEDSDLFREYVVTDSWRDIVGQLLDDYRFNVPYRDKEADKRFLVTTITKRFAPIVKDTGSLPIRVAVLDAIFYRNKGAYLVGRSEFPNDQYQPFVIALMHDDSGVYVDALVTDADEVSVIFSFTRAYFMVDSPEPAQIVNFLHAMVPHKQPYELYASIGFRKHAKTVFYRDVMSHLEHSDDQFIEAPGIRGMVMVVFTLPSYDTVFKLIKDRFTPPKEVTEAIVREKYLLVTKHDRAGRMADTQEFNGMRLPKARFNDALLNTLLELAPSKVRLVGDDVVIEHMYTERRMEPLNMYLATASDNDIDIVMKDYGKAIKDLAAANIFPGDMLLKNFGVTRQQRVVFYDYDELCYLTDCNFRRIPEPQTEEQEMSSTPWYNVAPEDVFPEEFRLFFSGAPAAKNAFEKYHADLYQSELWQRLQQQIQQGVVMDVYPYSRRHQRAMDVIS